MRFLPLFLLTMILLQSHRASGQTLLAEKPESHQLVPEGAVVEKLAGGFQFVEGPAWNPVGGFLIFSDIPADKIFRYDPATKATTVFRAPSRHANGNCFDASGELLYTCEHGTRSLGIAVGTVSMPTIKLITAYDGKTLNSPNDVVVKSDGSVWFTDPTYGLNGEPKEQSSNNVYRHQEKGGDLRAVATDFVQPNGLCFSPDEKLLYIADSGQPRHVRVFDVTADNRLANGRVFCQIDQGVPDGIRCDRHGNLFSTSGDSIQIFAPDGTRLGKILVPETPANLCFGGKDLNELYITAKTSLYRIKLTTAPAVFKPR